MNAPYPTNHSSLISTIDHEGQLFRGFRQQLVADLSPHERAVLSYLARGLSVAEMAHQLGCDPGLIYRTTRMLRCRFATRTLAGVVGYAIRLGIITTDGTLLPLP